ncbi:MAG TPA: serine/threonine-protein kinase [Polyangiaceae bacterium LLY-WYZ-15_(1-7)]|nr:hypothetical protein [Myxococcales bacterium]MAT25930.1 hypothetical protein [Sandaracinus sp.]HJL02265.1 serine/threonine-protein kinase [Polyangiaceae bacterium LLY-WYZ-15_(1-7)]MBJ71321.1 hypothetical protein [Sandaracinus sp.]HJL09295.1 serine/threonine-protein kinase [Polyangiaceae bacterium LLY-WYZ-15_(1-7)]
MATSDSSADLLRGPGGVSSSWDLDEGASSRHQEPRRGDLLGRYEILFPIASGGMATVYAARLAGAEGFQKPVALKLMLPHLARDERFVAMFLDEATLASRVHSPHVVSTLDLGREDDTLYMAMELVLGATLRDLLEEARTRGRILPVRVAATLAMQIAHGLADAHEARGVDGEPLHLIHRDVTPHNVLVGLDGRARLSDFGVAFAVERHSRTESGQVKGKLAYFSPEQLDGEPLDQRSDVFSLGAVAWECLVGRRLFGAQNPLALAAEVAYGEIARVDAERPGVPREVADVIARALARNPAERTDSAATFARHLGEALAVSVGVADPSEVAAHVRSLAGARARQLEERVRAAMARPAARLSTGRVALEESGPRPVATAPARRGAWLAAAVVSLGVAAGAAGALLAPAGESDAAEAVETGGPADARDRAEAEASGAGARAQAEDQVRDRPRAAEGAEAPARAEAEAPAGAEAEAEAQAEAEARAQAEADVEAQAEPGAGADEEADRRARRRAARRRRARRARMEEPARAPAPETEGAPRLLPVDAFDAQRER